MKISDRIRLEHHGAILDIGATDIHNATATAGWIDTALYDQYAFYVIIGPTANETWNGADQLDNLHINQANTSTGGGTKALVPAVNIDQTAVNTAGETFCLECKASDLDTEGGFRWIRLECSEGGNTGDDYCLVSVIMYGARYQHDDMSATTADA